MLTIQIDPQRLAQGSNDTYRLRLYANDALVRGVEGLTFQQLCRQVMGFMVEWLPPTKVDLSVDVEGRT